jgi:hypothetical protein
VSDMNGDTADVMAHELDRPAVESGADADVERRQRLRDHDCGVDGLPGPVEGGEEAVAGGLDFVATEVSQRGSYGSVVVVEHFQPAAISEPS